MVFYDSVSVMLICANLISLLRAQSRSIDMQLNNLQSGAGIYALYVVNWLVQLNGLTLMNMSIYGNTD